MSKIKNIILFGCGVHYQEKYNEVLKKENVNVVLVVDLKSNKKSIKDFFLKNEPSAKKFLFLDEKYRNEISFDIIDQFIKKLINLSEIEGVIISTEPKVRKIYTIWAIKNNFPIFMDKPISAFSNIENVFTLRKDFEEIAKIKKKSNVKIVVSCERRQHYGYLWLKNYLIKFMKDVKVPITSIEISFAGGIWRLLDEFSIIENHPFKYGYGILLHSGYHYIDLLANLLDLNKHVTQLENIKYSVKALATRPFDLLNSLNRHYEYDYYNKEKGLSPFFSVNKKSSFGETDVMVIGQLKKNDFPLTNFSIKLLGTSLSLRQSDRLSNKIEGKIRQEKIILHIGHLCSIHIESFPFKKINSDKYPIEDFLITIMNSPLLNKYKPIIKLDRRKISKLYSDVPMSSSLNTFSRQSQLASFLNNQDCNSSFESHKNTINLLHMIYKDIKKNYRFR